MKHPNAETLANTFRDLSEEQAQLVCELCDAADNADTLLDLWDRVFELGRGFSSPAGGLSSVQARRSYVLAAIDRLLGTHGVEALFSDREGPVVEYLNAGDTYNTTLIYHQETDELTIGCWGALLEAFEAEQEEAFEAEQDDEPEPEDEGPTGYVPCGCPDCFETAVGRPGDYCNDCEAAGCDGGECLVLGAYGGPEA